MVQVISATLQPSLCATGKSDPQPLRVGLYQMKWYDDPSEHLKQLHAGVAACAHAGAQIVFLPELTLSRYPADKRPESVGDRQPEDIMTGPSVAFAKDAARENDVFVQVSLYEKVERDDELGFNTALLVAPNGEIVAQTRKLHIPVTEGYFEDCYFAEGPSDNPYPVHGVAVDSADVKVGLAHLLGRMVPGSGTKLWASGSRPAVLPRRPLDLSQIILSSIHDPFGNRSLWATRLPMVLFIAVPNRTGTEGLIRFYGGSFIADPFGRILVEAPENEEVALVAEIDLNHRQDWLQLFPFFATRRP
jgi:N-carbamoylputrescine amidase